jgi:hypothetical protein
MEGIGHGFGISVDESSYFSYNTGQYIGTDMC